MTEFTDEGSLVVFTDSSSNGDSLFKTSIRKVYSFSSNNHSIITSLLDMKRLREMLLDDHINIPSSGCTTKSDNFLKGTQTTAFAIIFTGSVLKSQLFKIQVCHYNYQ